MNKIINGSELKLMTGDITLQTTEAIVNAANGTLMGGGGVDGAIHKRAGRELLEACKDVRKHELNGDKLPTGEAVITKGFDLPADWVIHTVGPVWNGDESLKKEQLANCYRHTLNLAFDQGITSIAFPSISTGAYHFPADLASDIAMTTIKDFLQTKPFGEVVMVLFSDQDYRIYKAALDKH